MWLKERIIIKVVTVIVDEVLWGGYGQGSAQNRLYRTEK